MYSSTSKCADSRFWVDDKKTDASRTSEILLNREITTTDDGAYQVMNIIIDRHVACGRDKSK